jgi:spore coat polysaccharide biosynthesis protein SpsF
MIQARTGSKRFPKKVLARIQNKPLIYYIISRAKKTKTNQIVLLTTKKTEDKTLLRLAKKYQILGYSGEINDVLSRFYHCAIEFDADPIIRITGDCPMIDSKIIDKLLDVYLKNNYDYVTNTLHPTFPDGLDVEIFSFSALEKAFKNAKLKSEREHVTPYIRNNRKIFKIFNFVNDENLSHLRWTVDEKKDLKLVRKIYSLMKPNVNFNYKQILKIISKNPSLTKINNGIQRNEGYLISLRKDKSL